MNNRHLQMLLAATKLYSGGIDGVIGSKTLAALHAAEQKYKDWYEFDPSGSAMFRREVACAQACLKELGHEPGKVDGWNGLNTTEALNAFLYKTANGKDEVIDRTPTPAALAKPAPSSIPHQSEVGRVYGTPGPQIESRLTTIVVPFSLRLDWNLRTKTSKIRVHQLAAPQLLKALTEVHAHYGIEKMSELGIDRYGGAYNHRKMRGGSSWSMHAYGCAIDFYAAPNGLRTRCPEALFCKPEYKDFLDIMEANEWLPAIRLWGADAMHFQRARI